jgi:hypothetical protein
MKSKAALFWVLSVVVVSIAVFVYFIRQEPETSQIIIPTTSYVDEAEIVNAVTSLASEDIKQNTSYWIGIEPEKEEQLDVIVELKKAIEKTQKLDKLILDQELSLPADIQAQIGNPEVISLKANIFLIGEKLAELEKKKIGYLLITASIYSNSFLKKNPIDVMKEKFGINPLTFSLAYFPAELKDEKNMLFPCLTEDRSGTADWGCVVVNTARTSRRKIQKDSPKPWIGLMNKANKKDYFVLLKRK